MSYLNTVRRHNGGRIAVTAGVLAAGLLASMMGPAFSLATAGQAVAADAGSYVEQVLARNGDNAIDPDLGRYYRIPALVDLGGGVVLASYDGRPDGGDAPSPNSIVQRRSVDGGKTWGVPTYVARGQEAKNGNRKFGFSDPSYVFDKVTGDVFNFHVYSKDQGFGGSGFGNDDTDRNIIGVEVSVSRDKGLSWSTDPGNMPNLPPVDYTAGSQYAGLDGPLITDVVKPVGDATNVGGVSGVFAASGEGIQLQYGPNKGRLIQQFTGKVKQADGSVPYQAYSVYSDDHGKTWQRGEFTGTGMDENKSVELSNGDVMLNSRASAGGQGGRKVAVSKDGGQTYGPVSVDTTLVDPVNNASITRMYPNATQGSAEAKILLFSNANSNNGRQNGTIRYSCNDGGTWSAGKQFKSGAMSYSTATALSDGTFGFFYEGDSNAMTFGKFDAAWLGVDCASAITGTVSAAPVSGANGTTVQAKLTIKNDGNAAVDGATATFAAKAGWVLGATVVPTVAPGASVTVDVPVTIPSYAKAGTVTLTANVSAGGPALTAPVPVTVTGGATANIVGLDVKGSATDTTRDLAANPYPVGAAVPYKFVVTSLSNIVGNVVPVTGNFNPLLPPLPGNCRWNNLAAEGSFTCSSPKHAVTESELAQGFFVPATTWSISGTGAETQNYTITGAEVDLLVRKPSLSLTYTPGALVDVDSSGFASVGDTVTYTSVVTNNGNVKLTGVDGFGTDGFDLAVNESKTVTSVYTLTAADVAANKVSAKGLVVNAKNGQKVTATSASAPSVAACSDELCGKQPPMENLIPQSQISIASVSSQELTGEAAPNGPAKALLDGNVESFWHTKWQGASDKFPHSVVFDLGKSYDVTGFEYTQRQNGTNGRIKDYEIFVSENTTEFGEKVASGSFAAVMDAQRISIAGNKVGRYVKLVGLNSIAGNEFAGGAEVNIGGLAVTAATATIAVVPGTVEAGKDIALSLSGFPANSPVGLTLAGGVSLGSVTTDASGSADITLAVPEGTPAGSNNVTAVSGTVTATVGLTVTSPAVTPVVGATIKGARADTSRDLATNPYDVGQELPYNFDVKSTAGIVSTVYPTAGDFSGFNISGTPNCRYRNLPAGGGFTCTTAKHVITVKDVADGFFQPVTKWTSEGAGATSVEYTVDGGEVDVLVRKPSLALTIGAGVLDDRNGDGYANVGDIVTFSVTAKNDGNVALTGVALPGVDGAAATLAAGASTSGTIKHTVTAVDLAAGKVAGVSVSAAAVNGSKAVSKDASGTAFALTLAPESTPTTEPTTTPTGEPTATPAADKATVAVSVGELVAGQAVTITGENFKPGTTATFTLHSEPLALGSATVAANGTVSLTATVPADVPAGQHSVVITGTGVSGEAVEVSIPLTVPAAGSWPAGDTPATSATASASTSASDDLANTGFNMMPLGLAGAVLVLLGGLVVVRRASVRGARH